MNRPEAVEVAVIGSGAIGGYLARAAAAAGHAVTLCVRTPIDRLEIREKDGDFRSVPVRIVSDPADLGGCGPAPWVVVAVKAQDTPSAAPWLARLAGPETVVVAAQNGIEQRERLSPFVSADAVMPALVYVTVERVAPGRIVHHSGSRVVVPEGAAGAAFARLLSGSGTKVEPAADFTTALWQKLLSNIAANPITALTMRRIGVLLEPEVRDLAATVLREAVAAGRAAGAALSETDVAERLDVYAAYRPDSTGGTSMLYDRLAGRPLEYDHITGALIRSAERTGTPVPLNRAIYALLKGLDGALRQPGG